MKQLEGFLEFPGRRAIVSPLGFQHSGIVIHIGILRVKLSGAVQGGARLFRILQVDAGAGNADLELVGRRTRFEGFLEFLQR